MNTEPHRSTWYYSLIIGVIMLITWVFLIVSGDKEVFQNEFIAYLFHWYSEFCTAFLLIVTGLQLRRRIHKNLNLLFLAFGFLTASVGGAFIYYLLNFELIIFIFVTLITGTTIIMLIINYNSLKHLIFLTNGISLYTLINILGQGLQEINITIITMAAPALTFIFILTITLYNKEVVLRYEQ